MQVYKTIIGHSVRYIRAASREAARLESSRIWKGVCNAVFPMGEVAPDIGHVGYDRVCHATEGEAEYNPLPIAKKASGKLNSKFNSFYRKVKAAPCRNVLMADQYTII